MNCQDFETSIVEIARNRLMDASVRERGLKHVEACEQCMALLNEERALSARLSALSAETVAEEIPANLETAVLAAYRQNVAANAEPEYSASPLKRRWMLAAAAAILLALGISLTAWFATAPKHESIAINPTPEPTVLPVDKKTDARETAQPSKQELLATKNGLVIRDAKPDKRRKRPAKTDGSSQPLRGEIVTQFYPINQTSELIPLEGGQILRVKMPSANLIPLGIPFNQQRADETVMADVLVSNDGLARAIRLVY